MSKVGVVEQVVPWFLIGAMAGLIVSIILFWPCQSAQKNQMNKAQRQFIWEQMFFEHIQDIEVATDEQLTAAVLAARAEVKRIDELLSANQE